MIETLQHSLKAAGVRFVRILWCDNANLIRAKATHINHLGGLQRGVGISAAQQALPVMYDAVAVDSGLGPVGEAQLLPDWSTLRVLPYAPGHAQVMGDMQQEGQAWEHCPRDFLRQQLARLSAHGLSLKGAFENEFVLLRRVNDSLEPADQTIYAMTAGMNAHSEVVLELADALNAQGIEVDYYYAESAPGQQELSIRYQDALRAADEQIIFRETVRGVAQRHGLIASFLPKLFENAAGSGCHINMSLWRGEQSVTGDESHPTGLAPEARAFIAGILHHLPALSALTIPSCNSFRRIRPHFWAGAFTAWGYGNREAAVRVTRSHASKAANRFELKTADATANPYLALGATIATGLDGLEQSLPLPAEVTVDPGHMPGQERQEKAIYPLPAEFGKALEALEQNSYLLNTLGEARAKAYLAVKHMELAALKDLSLEDEVKMLVKRY